MQTITTISLPKQLAQKIELQVKEGQFASKSEFFRAAVKAYLNLQSGQVNWEVLAAPFRSQAKQKNLTEADINKSIEKSRHAKPQKSGN